MKQMIKYTGGKALKRAWKKQIRRYPDACGLALYQEGVDSIFGPSQNLVPFRQGFLMMSGFCTEVQDDGLTGKVVTIGYTKHYAIAMHELEYLDAGRKARGSKRRSHYLSTPLQQAIPGMLARLAMHARKFAARGAKGRGMALAGKSSGAP